VDKANVVWYLPGPDQKPRGPYTAEQVVAAVRAGQIHAGTLCWREGMPQWLPVGQIGELALSLASVQPRAPVVPPATSPAMPSVVVGSESPAQQRSVVGRLVSWGVLIAVLGAAGTVGYIWFQESSAIRKAERLIAAGEFKEAVRLMKSLEPDAYVFGKKAEYLGSVASVKEFASSAEKADAEDLKRPKSHLEKLFAADESWRSLGSTDLADLLRLVPRSAPDAVSRGAALADLLQELGLAQAKPLAKDLLALAKEVAEKNSENTAGWMDVAMATSILGRDDSLGGELLALILPGSEEKRQQFEQGAAAIRRWVGVQASLAKPLAAAVVQRIDALAQSGDNERCQRLLVLAQQLTADPQKKASLATKFLQIAGNLQPKDPEAARRAMAEAIRLDPSTDKNPKTASLWLQLHPNPTEEKLARYRSLLGPGDAVDPLVGVTLLADATTFGALRSNLADSYRTAALAAAKELLAKPSDAQDLDRRVVAFGESLHNAQRNSEAIALLEALLKAAPDSKLKVEIVTKIEQWRQLSGKTGTTEDDALEKFVDDNLKVTLLSAPGVIRTIMENPTAQQVIQVAEGCTADKFRSEEVALLRKWVNDGGILWVNNDVLTFFDVKYLHLTSGRWNCRPGVSADLCPLVKDVEVVQVFNYGQVALDLAHTRVYPLLRQGNSTCWSLVRYGKGWISDVKSVEPTIRDGRRFWLNFRLFCVGKIALADKEISVAGGIPAPGALGTSGDSAEIIEITSTQQLDKALGDLEKQQILWVKLVARDVKEEQVKKLQGWVETGGVLWLSTNLAGQFGFPVISAPVARNAMFINPLVAHDVVQGLSASVPVGIEVAAGDVLISGKRDVLVGQMTPLLTWSANAKATTPMWVACAERKRGEGTLVFRPQRFNTGTPPGLAMEENLRKWSMKIARVQGAKPQPTSEKAKPESEKTKPDAATQ
jgi:hypothetical protein